MEVLVHVLCGGNVPKFGSPHAVLPDLNVRMTTLAEYQSSQPDMVVAIAV